MKPSIVTVTSADESDVDITEAVEKSADQQSSEMPEESYPLETFFNSKVVFFIIDFISHDPDF